MTKCEFRNAKLEVRDAKPVVNENFSGMSIG